MNLNEDMDFCANKLFDNVVEQYIQVKWKGSWSADVGLFTIKISFSKFELRKRLHEQLGDPLICQKL